MAHHNQHKNQKFANGALQHPDHRELYYTTGYNAQRGPTCLICLDDISKTQLTLSHIDGLCNNAFHESCLVDGIPWSISTNNDAAAEENKPGPDCPSCPVCRQLLWHSSRAEPATSLSAYLANVAEESSTDVERFLMIMSVLSMKNVEFLIRIAQAAPGKLGDILIMRMSDKVGRIIVGCIEDIKSGIDIDQILKDSTRLTEEYFALLFHFALNMRRCHGNSATN